MADSLQAYFRHQGIPLVEIEPGAETPVSFGDPATEHHVTRRFAGLFDFSFMSCFELAGPQARRYLARLQTRNLTRLRLGRLFYTLLLREDGSVFIDATLWDFGDGRYWIMTGRRSDRIHLEDLASDHDVRLVDLSGRHVVLALQGPRSHDLLAALVGEDVRRLPFFGFHAFSVEGVRVLVARAGYSGEAGYELIVDSAHGVWLWQDMMRRFGPVGLAACGLEATDTLRVEAGFILFLRELAWRVTPHMLGLARLVDAPEGSFLGGDALRAMGQRRSAARLVGILPCRQSLPEPAPVLSTSPAILVPPPGRVVLTSLAASPTLGRMHGLGFVNAADAYPGTAVLTHTGVRATVARLPFYDPLKQRPRC